MNTKTVLGLNILPAILIVSSLFRSAAVNVRAGHWSLLPCSRLSYHVIPSDHTCDVVSDPKQLLLIDVVPYSISMKETCYTPPRLQKPSPQYHNASAMPDTLLPNYYRITHYLTHAIPKPTTSPSSRLR